MTFAKKLKSALEKGAAHLLSKRVKHFSEIIIVTVAIVSFFIHLLIISLVKFKYLVVADSSGLLSNPLHAVFIHPHL